MTALPCDAGDDRRGDATMDVQRPGDRKTAEHDAGREQVQLQSVAAEGAVERGPTSMPMA